MTKSTQFFDLIAEDLMSNWLKGWPEYAQEPADDKFSIVHLSKKVAEMKKVSMDDKEGFEVVCKAITNIAGYCKYSEKFAPTNLHFINRAFQTLYNEMAAKHRIARLRDTGNYYNYKK